MILEYDKRKEATIDEKVQSLMESVQRAFNTLDGNTITGTIDGGRVKIVRVEGSNIIGEIDGNYVFVKNLDASQIVTGSISAERMTAEVINAVNSAIEKIDAGVIDVDTLKADYFDSVYAKIENLDADYVKVDKANISEAWIKDLLIQGKVVALDGTVYNLTGVHISGDLIDANTIIADKLILQGEDGLYYELNAKGYSQLLPESERLELGYALDGSNIIANSITGTQITAEAIEGTHGWIRLTDGERKYAVVDGEEYKVYEEDETYFYLTFENESWVKKTVSTSDVITENLEGGTFEFRNATTGNGISWNGENLDITASQIVMTSPRYRKCQESDVYDSDSTYYKADGTEYSPQPTADEFNVSKGSFYLRATNNLLERLNFQDNEVSELQDKTANIEGRVSNIQQGVIVDTSVPSVIIKAGGQSVEIASDDIRIKEGSQALATFGSNRMRVTNQYVTNYYPRLKQGDTYIGKLGWIARSNGHLSLKPVVGDED